MKITGGNYEKGETQTNGTKRWQQEEELSKPERNPNENPISEEVINNSFRGGKALETDSFLMGEPRYEGTQKTHSNDIKTFSFQGQQPSVSSLC